MLNPPLLLVSIHRYWFHRATALGGAVAGLIVHVAAPEAVRAVVAVLRSGRVRGHRLAAADAVEPLMGVRLVCLPAAAILRSQGQRILLYAWSSVIEA